MKELHKSLSLMCFILFTYIAIANLFFHEVPSWWIWTITLVLLALDSLNEYLDDRGSKNK